MQKFHDHYNVTDLITVGRVTKDAMLGLAAEGRVPIAVWAENIYVWPVHYSQKRKMYLSMATDSRRCNGEWFYVRRKDLRQQEFERISDEELAEDVARNRYDNKPALLKLLRSGPEADVDTTISKSGFSVRRLGRGLNISLDDLWVPADAWNMIEEEARKESENAPAFEIARRVYAGMLAEHKNNGALPHPRKCSNTPVYRHLARQPVPPNSTHYWINDPKRDPNEVGKKTGIGTLAVLYYPEDANTSTDPLEIKFTKFMKAFDQIKLR